MEDVLILFHNRLKPPCNNDPFLWVIWGFLFQISFHKFDQILGMGLDNETLLFLSGHDLVYVTWGQFQLLKNGFLLGVDIGNIMGFPQVIQLSGVCVESIQFIPEEIISIYR
jgi:hypothetical protein